MMQMENEITYAPLLYFVFVFGEADRMLHHTTFIKLLHSSNLEVSHKPRIHADNSNKDYILLGPQVPV